MADIPPNEAERPELERVVATLRNRWGLVLVCFAATTLAALGFSLIQQKEYSASASLLFRDPGYAEALYGTAVTTTSPDPVREAATNLRLVGLDAVASRTAAALGRDLSGLEIADRIEVSEEGESDVVSITATDSQPRRAALLANAFARQFVAFRIEADRGNLRDAQRLAERQFDELTAAERAGPRGQALSGAAERLGVLASLQTGNAELVEPARAPSSPSAPRTKRNTLLGVLIGLLLGIGLAFLLERLNRRLRDPEEAGAAYGLPVLGTIPLSKTLAAVDEGGTGLPFAEEEAFRTLRAGLRYFNVDREVRSTLVTSYSAGEGKSTVAWHLARVAARGSRAILVEADLRNPVLATAHGLPRGPGLAELLTHQVELEEAVRDVPLGEGGSDGSLAAISAGASPPNPAELLESQAMSDLLRRLAGEYEFVVVDTPPTGVVSDAFPLLSGVSGVIVVSRMGMASRDSAARLRDQLHQLGAPLLGVVANGVKLRGRDRYGYGRGYYGRREVEPEEKAPAAAAR